MTDMKTYSGGCHCGAVRYEVDMALEQGMSCNCSICTKRGHVLAFAEVGAFRLQSGEDNLQDYRFNQHKIAHLFCRTCGVQSFARGENGAGVPMIGVNLRCVDGVDLDALPVNRFDGANL